MGQRFLCDDATETGIPVSVLALDSERFDFAFQFAVQFNLDVADFGQLQLVREFETRLRIGE
jgi:hypothetical protein